MMEVNLLTSVHVIKLTSLFKFGAATTESPSTIALTKGPDVTTQEPGILFCSLVSKLFCIVWPKYNFYLFSVSYLFIIDKGFAYFQLLSTYLLNNSSTMI